MEDDSIEGYVESLEEERTQRGGSVPPTPQGNYLCATPQAADRCACGHIRARHLRNPDLSHQCAQCQCLDFRVAQESLRCSTCGYPEPPFWHGPNNQVVCNACFRSLTLFTTAKDRWRKMEEAPVQPGPAPWTPEDEARWQEYQQRRAMFREQVGKLLDYIKPVNRQANIDTLIEHAHEFRTVLKPFDQGGKS